MFPVLTAFFWQFWHRHWVALFSGMLTVAVLGSVLHWWPLTTIPLEAAALIALLPLLHLVYALPVFGFGCDSDLLDCGSSYPSYMLRLPISTRLLVVVPFLYGLLAIVLSWLAIQALILQPLAELTSADRFGPPLWLTPSVSVAALAWVQAVLWRNYKFVTARVGSVVTAFVLPALIAYLGVWYGFSERFLLYCFLAVAAAGVVFAARSLHRTRCGLGSGKLATGLSLREGLAQRAKKPRDFRSAMGAQVWYEWQRYLLPVVCCVVVWMGLLFGLSLYWPDSRFPRDGLLVAPIYISTIAALGIGGLNHSVGTRQASPFFAARPLSSFQFVAAKWSAAGIATSVVCGLGLAGFALLSWFTGQTPSWFSERWEMSLEHYSWTKTILGFGFLVVVYFAMTWVLMTQALPIKLSGRYWLETLFMWVGMSLFGFLMLGLIEDRELRPILAWVVSGLLLLKGTLAVIVLRGTIQHRVLLPATITAILVVWLLMASLCAGMLRWFGTLGDTRSLLLAVGLLLLFWPVTRIAAAPLALHVNRHR